jgi:quinol monooxygenase YgiN
MEKNQEAVKVNQKTEHVKKVRRRIEEKLRNEMGDKEIEALGIILKVQTDTEK